MQSSQTKRSNGILVAFRASAGAVRGDGHGHILCATITASVPIPTAKIASFAISLCRLNHCRNRRYRDRQIMLRSSRSKIHRPSLLRLAGHGCLSGEPFRSYARLLLALRLLARLVIVHGIAGESWRPRGTETRRGLLRSDRPSILSSMDYSAGSIITHQKRERLVRGPETFNSAIFVYNTSIPYAMKRPSPIFSTLCCTVSVTLSLIGAFGLHQSTMHLHGQFSLRDGAKLALAHHPLVLFVRAPDVIFELAVALRKMRRHRVCAWSCVLPPRPASCCRWVADGLAEVDLCITTRPYGPPAPRQTGDSDLARIAERLMKSLRARDFYQCQRKAC